MSETPEPKKIFLKGFTVPATFHDALQILIDGLKYGEIGYGRSHVVHGTHQQIDTYSPAGFFLTVDQVELYVNSEDPFDEFGRINFAAMYGMKVDDMIEIQSWYNEVKTHHLQVDEKVDWQAARLEMMEFLEQLKEHRPNYENPGLAHSI